MSNSKNNQISDFLKDMPNISDMFKQAYAPDGQLNKLLNNSGFPSSKAEISNKHSHKVVSLLGVSFPEAHCIMKYRCTECGHEEFLWNSRDGVTPFAIACKHDGCKGRKQHTNGSRDLPILDLKPMGIRWFVDLSREKHEEYVEDVLDRIEKKDGFPVKTLGGEMSKEKIRESFLKDFKDGEPDIFDPRQKESVLDEASYPGP